VLQAFLLLLAPLLDLAVVVTVAELASWLMRQILFIRIFKTEEMVLQYKFINIEFRLV
jgi:hypothetical protein